MTLDLGRLATKLDSEVAEIRSGTSGRAPAPVISLFGGSHRGGPESAFGQHDGPVTHMLAEGTTTSPEEVLIEFRGRSDLRPRLDASNRATVLDWFRENMGGEALPGFYVRDGGLVRVPRVGEEMTPEEESMTPDELAELREKQGPAQVRSMTPTAVMSVVQEHLWPYTEKAEYEKEKSGRVVKVTRRRHHEMVDSTVCRGAIEGVAEWSVVPRITGVSHTPTLRADGSLIADSGYDERSGVLFLPDSSLTMTQIPALGDISDDWLGWARDTILFVLADFPFEDEEYKANLLALLLTPLMRRVVPPPYPMFLINAHQRGSGKSYLAAIASTLHGGLSRPDLTGDDEEIRKQITSILSSTTAPVVNFDNVTTVIRSGNIANLLTSKTWTDRPLGRTDNVSCTNDRIWVATGNNLRIGGDMARRTLYVNLDPGVARPELRTGFKIDNLSEYVKTKRGELLSALLVILGHWVQRGMPGRSGGGVRSDDYGPWAGAMKEILEGAGLVKAGAFTGGASSVAGALVSDDESELAMLVAQLAEVFGGAEFQIKDVRKEHENEAMGGGSAFGTGPTDLDDALPGSVKAARDMWKSLGRYLLRHERTFTSDNLRLRKVRDARGGAVWMVERSAE